LRSIWERYQLGFLIAHRLSTVATRFPSLLGVYDLIGKQNRS
jgi:hypothetical protein